MCCSVVYSWDAANMALNNPRTMQPSPSSSLSSGLTCTCHDRWRRSSLCHFGSCGSADPPWSLVGACLATGDRILATGSDTLPTKIYAVNCKLFLEHLRCAVTISGSETMILFMQLHLPYFFPGVPSNMRLQLSRLLEMFILCICSSGDFQN